MARIKALAATAFLVLPLLVSPPARAEMSHHESGGHEHPGAEEQVQRGHHATAGSHDMAMDEVLEKYFAIVSSLSQDSMKDVRSNAKALAEAAARLEKEPTGKSADALRALLAEISDVAKSLAEKTDIGPARAEFAKLSEKLIDYQVDFGDRESGSIHVFACDMAKKMWLQKNEAPGNPYLGPAMAKCRRKID